MKLTRYWSQWNLPIHMHIHVYIIWPFNEWHTYYCMCFFFFLNITLFEGTLISNSQSLSKQQVAQTRSLQISCKSALNSGIVICMHVWHLFTDRFLVLRLYSITWIFWNSFSKKWTCYSIHARSILLKIYWEEGSIWEAERESFTLNILIVYILSNKVLNAYRTPITPNCTMIQMLCELMSKLSCAKVLLLVHCKDSNYWCFRLIVSRLVWYGIMFPVIWCACLVNN